MQGGVGKNRRILSPGRLNGPVRNMALTSDRHGPGIRQEQGTGIRQAGLDLLPAAGARQ